MLTAAAATVGLRCVLQDPSRVHLRRPTLRYYASEAPVADIRDACHSLLQLDAQMPVSAPSNYVDSSLFNPESGLDNSLEVLSDTFYSAGRSANTQRHSSSVRGTTAE